MILYDDIRFSSERYEVYTENLLSLEVEPLNNFKGEFSPDEIIVLLGDAAAGQDDYIISGAEKLRQAANEVRMSVPVRFVFIPPRSRWACCAWMIKKLRRRFAKRSPRMYQIKAETIRELNLERKVRTVENAYILSNKKWKIPYEDAQKKYAELVGSMQDNGYDLTQPVTIMACRHLGVKDTLQDGHHRIAAALDTGQPFISIQFTYSFAAPRFGEKYLGKIALYNMRRKQR